MAYEQLSARDRKIMEEYTGLDRFRPYISARSYNDNLIRHVYGANSVAEYNSHIYPSSPQELYDMMHWNSDKEARMNALAANYRGGKRPDFSDIDKNYNSFQKDVLNDYFDERISIQNDTSMSAAERNEALRIFGRVLDKYNAERHMMIDRSVAMVKYLVEKGYSFDIAADKNSGQLVLKAEDFNMEIRLLDADIDDKGRRVNMYGGSRIYIDGATFRFSSKVYGANQIGGLITPKAAVDNLRFALGEEVNRQVVEVDSNGNPHYVDADTVVGQPDANMFNTDFSKTNPPDTYFVDSGSTFTTKYTVNSNLNIYVENETKPSSSEVFRPMFLKDKNRYETDAEVLSRAEEYVETNRENAIANFTFRLKLQAVDALAKAYADGQFTADPEWSNDNDFIIGVQKQYFDARKKLYAIEDEDERQSALNEHTAEFDKYVADMFGTEVRDIANGKGGKVNPLLIAAYMDDSRGSMTKEQSMVNALKYIKKYSNNPYEIDRTEDDSNQYFMDSFENRLIIYDESTARNILPGSTDFSDFGPQQKFWQRIGTSIYKTLRSSGIQVSSMSVDDNGIVHYEGERRVGMFSKSVDLDKDGHHVYVNIGENGKLIEKSAFISGDIGQIFVPEPDFNPDGTKNIYAGLLKIKTASGRNRYDVPCYIAKVDSRKHLADNSTWVELSSCFDYTDNIIEAIEIELRHDTIVSSEYNNYKDNSTALNNVVAKVRAATLPLDFVEDAHAHGLDDEFIRARLDTYRNFVLYPGDYREDAGIRAEHDAKNIEGIFYITDKYAESHRVIMRDEHGNPVMDRRSGQPIMRPLAEGDSITDENGYKGVVGYVANTKNLDKSRTIDDITSDMSYREQADIIFANDSDKGILDIPSCKNDMRYNIREIMGSRNPETLGNYFCNFSGGKDENANRRFILTKNAKIGPDKHIIPGDTNRSPMMSLDIFKHCDKNSAEKQLQAFQNSMTAKGLSRNTGIAHVCFGGATQDDAYVVSSDWAERNAIKPEHGGEMRPLKIGDKIQDLHGNKGVISAVVSRNIPADMTEAEYYDKYFNPREIPDGISDEEREAIESDNYERNYRKTMYEFFRDNPDVDIVSAPFTEVSRYCGGFMREGLESQQWAEENGKSTTLIINGEEKAHGISYINMEITDKDADSKNKVYDGVGGRQSSIQLVSAMAELGGFDVIEEIYGTNVMPYAKSRELLIAMGYDLDECAVMQKGYTPHILGVDENGNPIKESRPILSVKEQYFNNFDFEKGTVFRNGYRDAFRDMIGKEGGFIEIPFPIQLSELSMDEEKNKNFTPNSPSSNGYLLPVLAGKYRSDNQTIDGVYSRQEYTADYERIWVAMRDYHDPKTSEADREAIQKRVQGEYDKLSGKIAERYFEGKHNYWKEGVMRKQLHHTSTAVITPDASLNLDEFAMPAFMAEAMEISPDYPYTMAWRDPVLSGGGVGYFKVKIVETRPDHEGYDPNNPLNSLMGIAMNPTIANSYEADYDGDTFGLYSPKSEKARRNAEETFSPRNNPAKLLNCECVSRDYNPDDKSTYNKKHGLYLTLNQDVAAGINANPAAGEAFVKAQEKANEALRCEDAAQRRAMTQEAFAMANKANNDAHAACTGQCALTWASAMDHCMSLANYTGIGAKGKDKNIIAHMKAAGYYPVDKKGKPYAEDKLPVNKKTGKIDFMAIADWKDAGQSLSSSSDRTASCMAMLAKKELTAIGGTMLQNALTAGVFTKKNGEFDAEGFQKATAASMALTHSVTQSIMQLKHQTTPEILAKVDVILDAVQEHWAGHKLNYNEQTGKWETEMVTVYDKKGNASLQPKQCTANEWKEQIYKFYTSPNGLAVDRPAPEHVEIITSLLKDEKGIIQGVQHNKYSDTRKTSYQLAFGGNRKTIENAVGQSLADGNPYMVPKRIRDNIEYRNNGQEDKIRSFSGNKGKQLDDKSSMRPSVDALYEALESKEIGNLDDIIFRDPVTKEITVTSKTDSEKTHVRNVKVAYDKLTSEQQEQARERAYAIYAKNGNFETGITKNEEKYVKTVQEETRRYVYDIMETCGKLSSEASRRQVEASPRIVQDYVKALDDETRRWRESPNKIRLSVDNPEVKEQYPHLYEYMKAKVNVNPNPAPDARCEISDKYPSLQQWSQVDAKLKAAHAESVVNKAAEISQNYRADRDKRRHVGPVQSNASVDTAVSIASKVFAKEKSGYSPEEMSFIDTYKKQVTDKNFDAPEYAAFKQSKIAVAYVRCMTDSTNTSIEDKFNAAFESSKISVDDLRNFHESYVKSLRGEHNDTSRGYNTKDFVNAVAKYSNTDIDKINAKVLAADATVQRPTPVVDVPDKAPVKPKTKSEASVKSETKPVPSKMQAMGDVNIADSALENEKKEKAAAKSKNKNTGDAGE